jgi:hypothetical protein
MTFNVWYRLSELLYADDVDTKNDIFAPYIERLVLALYKHARYDTDHVSFGLFYCCFGSILLVLVFNLNCFFFVGRYTG